MDKDLLNRLLEAEAPFKPATKKELKDIGLMGAIKEADTPFKAATPDELNAREEARRSKLQWYHVAVPSMIYYEVEAANEKEAVAQAEDGDRTDEEMDWDRAEVELLR